jgi:hypothetical protein
MKWNGISDGMMEMVLRVPEYDASRGLSFEWDEGFEIGVEVLSSSEILVTANRAGLISLARHLLTLSQDGIASGRHLYLTADQELESSVNLILERRDKE